MYPQYEYANKHTEREYNIFHFRPRHTRTHARTIPSFGPRSNCWFTWVWVFLAVRHFCMFLLHGLKWASSKCRWLFQAITCPFSSHLKTIAQYVSIHAQARTRERKTVVIATAVILRLQLILMWQVDKLYTLFLKTTAIITTHANERKKRQSTRKPKERKINTKCTKKYFSPKKRDRCRSYYLIGMVSFIDRIKYCVFSLFRFVVVVVDSNGINGMQATIFFCYAFADIENSCATNTRMCA